MEYYMEARALKSSLRRELATKPTQQGFYEDFLFSNAPIHGPTGLVSSEDFSVDCFLDFSSSNCDEFKDSNPNYVQDQEIVEEEEEEEEEEKDFLSVSSSQDPVDEDNNSNSSSFMSDSLLTTELAVPDDDLAELEWVSHFVDDSLSEVSLLVPAWKGKTESHAQNPFEPEPKPTLTKISGFFPTRVPSKARTKRPRPTGRSWSAGYSATETSSLSSASSCSSIPGVLLTNTVQTIDSFPGLTEPTMKKQKKSPAVQTDGMMGLTQFQRRCSHCQVQKTPQWRTGPLGAKTLCNACGVRYKSGRLFPEYRPACSPTFSSEVHSNSHRKVLEMRRKKEMVGQESRSNQMVPSF